MHLRVSNHSRSYSRTRLSLRATVTLLWYLANLSRPSITLRTHANLDEPMVKFDRTMFCSSVIVLFKSLFLSCVTLFSRLSTSSLNSTDNSWKRGKKKMLTEWCLSLRLLLITPLAVITEPVIPNLERTPTLSPNSKDELYGTKQSTVLLHALALFFFRCCLFIPSLL